MSLKTTKDNYNKADYTHSQLDEIYNKLESGDFNESEKELLIMKGFKTIKTLEAILNKIDIRDLYGNYSEQIVTKIEHNVEFFYESTDYIKKFLYGIKYYDSLLNGVRTYFNDLRYFLKSDIGVYAQNEQDLAKKYVAMLLNPDNIYQFFNQIKRMALGTMSINEFKRIYNANKSKMNKIKKVSESKNNNNMKARLVKESLNETNEWEWILRKTPIQEENDKSAFYITLFGENVYAMGDEFNPESFNMTLDEMLDWIDEAIEYFSNWSKNDEISKDEIGEYTDFFVSELNDEDYESLSAAYIIAKLVCGKENAKWNSK